MKELEKIKEYIKEQTADMSESARATLLDDLAWWASQRGRVAQLRESRRRGLRQLTKELGRCKRTNTETVKHNLITT